MAPRTGRGKVRGHGEGARPRPRSNDGQMIFTRARPEFEPLAPCALLAWAAKDRPGITSRQHGSTGGRRATARQSSPGSPTAAIRSHRRGDRTPVRWVTLWP